MFQSCFGKGGAPLNSTSNLRRNFLWNTAGSLLYFASQWLFTILVWHVGSASQGVVYAGLLNTATALTNVFLSLASYGMYNYQVSDLQGKYAQSAYIQSRHYTCALSVLLCGLFLVGSFFTGAGYTFTESLCILLMLGFRMVESTTDVYNAIDQKHDRLDLVGKTYAARGVLSLVVFFLGLRFLEDLALTLLCMLAVNLAFFFLYTKPRVKPFYVKESVPGRVTLALLLECMPLAVYSFLNTTAASIPKLALKQLAGTDALGIYGSVTAPVLLLQVGATYLFTPFITMFADAYNKRDKRGFDKALFAVQGIILLLLPLGLLVARFLGEWGLATFVDPGLRGYAYLLGPMVLSAILTALVLFYSMVLTVMRCMKGLIAANVCAMAVAAAVCVPCIRAWNLQGATWAAVIALGMQVLFLLAVMLRHTRRHFAQGLPDENDMPMPENPDV